MDVCKKIFQIDYWITHDLAWAVISDISATVDVIIRGLNGAEVFFFEQQIILVTAFSKRINMGMLTKNKIIVG
jgi:hypothetical protein